MVVRARVGKQKVLGEGERLTLPGFPTPAFLLQA